MLYPLNKYLAVELCAEEARHEPTILVPDDAQVSVEPYKLVRLARAHPGSSLTRGDCLVVPTHSLEQIKLAGEEYHLVLESHVIARVEK